MSEPAFVRLGPTSSALSSELALSKHGDYPSTIELHCAQVPNDFDVGSFVWIWLGSDNNKGQQTAWAQGIRAIGHCEAKAPPADDEKHYVITIGGLYILEKTITKKDLLNSSPAFYAAELSDATIVGLNNYASQVVQLLKPREAAAIGAVVAHLSPTDSARLHSVLPEISTFDLFLPQKEAGQPLVMDEIESPLQSSALEPSALQENDPVLKAVRDLIFEDMAGGVILAGPPGTGKSWYARQIALKLTEGRLDRIREVQFHSSYQYEDFVEGYVPDSKTGFVLQDKHLLVMAKAASEAEGSFVLIIDELTRTDPSRVLGEALTYMESSYRGKNFRLPSGRIASLPSNLVLLATLNPEDRSVDELDEAMQRRWSKVYLNPNARTLAGFLEANGADAAFRSALVDFFSKVQKHAPLGHALFRSVHSASSLRRLWVSQLEGYFNRRFRYDKAQYEQVLMLWTALMDRVAPEAPPTTSQEDVQPEQNIPPA